MERIMANPNEDVKCYKSVSCIISMLIIAFVFCAILYDLVWSKPQISHDISAIRTEVRNLNSQIHKIDSMNQEVHQKFLEIAGVGAVTNKKEK
jgi:hypothetical protein